MGATRTTFTTSDGAKFCWTLLIEGYEDLITSHGDLGAVAIAYGASGLEWTRKNVVWTNKVNVTATDNDLENTGGSGAAWDAGATSTATLTGDGFVEFTTGESNKDKVCGLSNGNPGVSNTEIDFGIYLDGGPEVFAIENGTTSASLGSYVAGDIFRVEVKSNVVRYYQNGTLLKKSTGTPTFPLLVDTSFFDANGTIQDVVLVGAGSPITGVLGGLEPPGSIDSRLELWTGKIDAPALRIVIHPDAADTFGIAAHATVSDPTDPSTSLEAFMDETAGNLDSDDTTLTIDDNSSWPTSGSVYIGTEHMTYTGKGGATLTGLTRGLYAPFKADTETNQRFGQPHHIPIVTGSGVFKPRVTDYARVWTGKRVRLLLHAINGDTVDVFADAETVWAGTIESISDSKGGRTVLECRHLLDSVRNGVILRDQYTAKIKEGLYIGAGAWYDFHETSAIAFPFSVKDDNTATRMNVVASGANGADHATPEINEGYYTADEISTQIATWLAAQKVTHTTIKGMVTFKTELFDVGTRMSLVVNGNDYTGGANVVSFELTASADSLRIGTWEFLGFDPGDEVFFYRLKGTTEILDGDGNVTIQGSGAPLRTASGGVSGIYGFQVVQQSGTWENIDNTYIPDFMPNVSGEDWGIVQFDGKTYGVVRHASDTEFDGYSERATKALHGAFGIKKDEAMPDLNVRRTVDDESGDIIVKQVIGIKGGFKSVILRMLASTGTVGYNHATYDAWSAQLGLGIPWQALGDTFEQSMATLDAISPMRMNIFLTKPTKFEKIIRPEMLIRNAGLFLDNGEMRWMTPQATSGSSYTLTTSSKASAADADDPDRSGSSKTERWMRNKITVSYNRNPDSDKFTENRTVINEASIQDHGGLVAAHTIKMPNTYDVGDDSIDVALSLIAPWIVGVFSEPLTMVTRSINRKFFHLLPGDTVALSDDHVRAPETGLRGLTAYAAWVLNVRRNWKTGVGGVDLVLLGPRYGAYSPTARVSSYASGSKELTLVANTHRLAADGADIDDFSVSDKVRVVEISPASGTALTWVDTIAGITGNVATLTTGDGGVWDATKTWRMISDDYATAVTAQQADTYMADDADGEILGTVLGQYWSAGMPGVASISAADPTQRHRFPNGISDDEGEPVSTGLHADLIASVNNLLSYKTASQCPVLAGTTTGGNWQYETTSTDYVLMALFPFKAYALLESSDDDFTINLKAAPLFYRSAGSAGNVSCRITTCKSPPTGSSMTDVSFPAGSQQITFTNAAASPTFGTVTDIGLGPTAVNGSTIFLAVEMKVTSGDTGALCGVGELWKGPAE